MGYIQAVSTITEEPLTERAQVVPLAIEDHERVLSTRQDVHVVLAIHGHPGAFVKPDTLWEFAPTLDILVPKITDSIHLTHSWPPFIVAQNSYKWPILGPSALQVNAAAKITVNTRCAAGRCMT